MKERIYTHTPIGGTKPLKILPEGTALVLEGGGTRGFYSSGVFEAFMEEGIMFPYIIGVSAGAANALTYVAGQKMRSRQIVERYVADKRYVSLRNLFLKGSMFGIRFIFREIPEKHIFWDSNMFQSVDIRFLTGAMDCNSGKTVWFEKEDITSQLEAVIASCSVPILTKVVRFKGMDLLDGGISDPIPIEKSIKDGNKFHVIILTRNEGYIKKAFKHKSVLNIFYRKYPEAVQAILKRHEVYNYQFKLCEQLEKEGKAVIIRPKKPLEVDRTGADTAKLLSLYDEGIEEGREKIRCIKSLLEI